MLRTRNQDVERIRQEAAAAVDVITSQCEEKLGTREREYEGEVARMREEMERRERECKVRIQRAKNEVEDLWEGRWRDRLRVAGEEMERAVGRAREGVEEGWGRVLGGRWPERRGEWEEVRREVRAARVGGGGAVGWVAEGVKAVGGRERMWEPLRDEEWDGVYDGSNKAVKEKEGRWEGVWEGNKMIKGRRGRWEIRKEKEEREVRD